MPRDITVTFADGTTHVYRGAPDDITPEAVSARAQKDFGKGVASLDGGRAAPPGGGDAAAPPTSAPPATPGPGLLERGVSAVKGALADRAREMLDMSGGAVRGAGSIGATLLWPIDKATDIIKGDRGPTQAGLITGQQPKSRNEERRLEMEAALRDLGFDTDSGAFKVGKFGGEVAGTLGTGGLLAQGVRSVAPAAAARVPALLDALTTGGMRAGELTGLKALGVRTVGGAITGGAAGGLIDPDQAEKGALYGAAAPSVFKGIGLAGKGIGAVARGVRETMSSDTSRAAAELMRALDLQPQQVPAVVAALRGADRSVTNPTVAQALSKPQASILEKLVSEGPGGERLREALLAQAEARMAALNRVAPIAADGAAQMRADTGSAIARFARAEEGQATDAVRGLYRAVDPTGGVRMQVPVDDMQAALTKYLGPGTFGENTAAARALDVARQLSKPERAGAVILNEQGRPIINLGGQAQRAATWPEVLNLRSSIGEAMTKARDAGDKQAAAALGQMKQSIDDAVARAASGATRAGERFPAEAAATWLEANAAHAAKMQRFHTGPQAGIFQLRNGQPAREGGEIASLFWGNRPGLAEDVRSFRRLVADNPAQLGQFRSMLTTEGAQKAGQGGQLGQKFVDWVGNMKPGLREAFEPAELNALQRIADDIERAASASKLAATRGSDTYQKASHALSGGWLDSPGVQGFLERFVPGGRYVAAGASGVAKGAAQKKAERMAGLLADAVEAADALERRAPGRVSGLLSDAMEFPVTPSGVNLRQILDLGPYLAAPAAATAAAGLPPHGNR